MILQMEQTFSESVYSNTVYLFMKTIICRHPKYIRSESTRNVILKFNNDIQGQKVRLTCEQCIFSQKRY
jgi:hypothetical protein